MKLCVYLSYKMRTQKNRTIDYLDGLERDKIFMQVIKVGQNQRCKWEKKQKTS